MSSSIDKDDEFLLWIANRLVYKYGEDKNLVNKIISIIAKYRYIRSAYTEENKNTSLAISNTINYLTTLQSHMYKQHESLLSKIKTDKEVAQEKEVKISIDFDNLDIDSIIR